MQCSPAPQSGCGPSGPLGPGLPLASSSLCLVEQCLTGWSVAILAQATQVRLRAPGVKGVGFVHGSGACLRLLYCELIGGEIANLNFKKMSGSPPGLAAE